MLNHDSKSRSILKTLTWRTVASLDTFLIAWWITSNPWAGASIAGIEVLTKIGLYYLHERAWSHATVGALSHEKVEDETLSDFMHHHQPHFGHHKEEHENEDLADFIRKGQDRFRDK